MSLPAVMSLRSPVAAAVLAFLPSVAYDRYARRKETLTYTILRVF